MNTDMCHNAPNNVSITLDEDTDTAGTAEARHGTRHHWQQLAINKPQ